MRIRKMVGAKEELSRFGRLVLIETTEHCGLWQDYFQNSHPVHLEIGMGRGKFLVQMARSYPAINFIGLEFREELVYKAAKRAQPAPKNLVFILGNAAQLTDYFAPGELARIYLNFSDPWPKDRHAKRRLTADTFLRDYRLLLSPAGEIHLKTDNRALFQYSLNQLARHGFFLKNISLDLHEKGCGDNVTTEYEERYMKDQPIFRCEALKLEAIPAAEADLRKETRKMLQYISTRGNSQPVNGAEAIKLGMVPGGGLFVPETIPCLSGDEIAALAGQSYGEIARRIVSLYLPDYSVEEIAAMISQSYSPENFDHPDIAPLVPLDDQASILELWHGPTAAFKDMALQLMPRLLTAAREKVGSSKEILILVATSGDTGKAALEGFKNVPGIRIIVFYPHAGVSRMQELQMTTTDGSNTWAVAVQGNFDDCQTAVKEIFDDPDFNQLLNAHQIELSSANSINWGRLLPQIVYYFWAYGQLLHQGQVKAGEEINLVVPTGNFGNILAAYYAGRMGLPVHKLICASNANNVLTDTIQSGTYDRRREFIRTLSPSMDILISSNFERFLFEITGHDGDKTEEWFRLLGQQGFFAIDDQTFRAIQKILDGGFATDEETQETIKGVYQRFKYLLDPHTAVGYRVYENYRAKTGDTTKTVIDATANPFKFNSGVLQALAGAENIQGKDEFQLLADLSQLTGQPVHRGLRDLDRKPAHLRPAIGKEDLRREILAIIGLEKQA